MPRAAPTFRQADLTRALRAAEAAGVKVRIKITREGMEVVPIGDGGGLAKLAKPDDAGGALDAWRAGRDHQG